MSGAAPETIELESAPSREPDRPGRLSIEEAARLALGEMDGRRPALLQLLRAEERAAATVSGRPLHRLVGLIRGGPSDVAERHGDYASDPTAG